MKKRKHAFIPDTQVCPGVPINHLEAAGNYMADKRPDVIVMIGDWWDMNSLCSYDRIGSDGWEDKDVLEDFEIGIDAMDKFMRPIMKAKDYHPRLEFCMGNHEDRVRRAREDPENRRFKGFLSDEQFRLREYGWKIRKFLQPVVIDGVSYAHYFINPQTVFCKPYTATAQIETKIRGLGHSFSMGHQQTYQVGAIYTGNGQRRRGLVCGSFYQHEEEYLGPQKNKQHWRGIIMKHEVYRGDYELMEVSLPYLLNHWL